ncbi:VWA domain-containing protein [Vibrio tapetis subsp. quintayensis]|uniref:vWA domain-containing protein n=1 Tax=Vibrio tapetis TaxID=52443 RepID=UPI0025B5581A|nr:VWA domain-containing protein [Vibrio tapetis]MDN3681896.1 VWA domain-containing protein [Vibrio tapetis subsp. quintayensis]
MADFMFITPLWLLAILPAIALATWLIRNQSKQGLIASHIATGLGLAQSHTSHIPKILLVSWVFGCIALAGPSWQQQERPAFQLQSARVLVLDMSRSLYATDIKPNRLTQLKYKALDLLPKWKEGTTGLVAFAGDAYTLSPLTSDSETLADLIQNLTPEIMPFQGGNLQAGIEQAIQLMTEAGHQQGDVVVLADDIDSHQLEALKKHLQNQQWRISILAVGTQQGAPITQTDGTLLKDNSGVTVMATANLPGLQSLARSTGGVFSPIRQDNQDVDAIASFSATSRTDGHNSETNGEQLESRINNGFWLLPFVLLPLLSLFRKGWLFSLTLVILPLVPNQHAMAASLSAPLKNADQQGYESFQQQDYQQAANQFESKEWQGVAHYQAGEYQQAIDSLQGIDTPHAKYNLANALAQNGDLEKAKSAYQSLLKEAPNATDIKKNLSIVEQALKQKQEQEQEQQNQKQKDGDNDQPSHEQKGNDQHKSDRDQNQSNQSNQSNQGQPEQQSPSEERQSQAEQPDDEQSQNESSQEQPSSDDANQASQQKTEAEQKAEQDPNENESGHAKAASMTQDTDNTQQVDPNLRKLEQIQSQGDPSFLLKAQMLLQAQQKKSPNKVNKSW